MKHNLCIIAVSILTIPLHIYTMELARETESDQLFIERTRALAQQKREIPEYCYEHIPPVQHNNILHCAYSPHNKKIALITPLTVHRDWPQQPLLWENQTVLIFDSKSKSLLHKEKLDLNTCHDGVAISNNGNMFATLCNGKLNIKNITTQKIETYVFIYDPYKFPQPYIAFNRQGTHIIVHNHYSTIVPYTIFELTVNKNNDHAKHLEQQIVYKHFMT